MNSGPFGADSGQQENPVARSAAAQKVSRAYQYWLDRSTPHPIPRWVLLVAVVAIYGVRVYLLQGFYIVSYALGIYNLNLLLGFLTPQIDPEMEGPTLPDKGSDEFRPFVRRLPEFKFWHSSVKAFLLGFVATFFPIFDVPVFWPILLLYWLVLLFVTMRRQIKHMIKYRYVPFSWGKKAYRGKNSVKLSK